MSLRTCLRAWVFAAVWVLTSCGGSDGTPPAPANEVGPAGGTVSGPSGTQVSVPAGALAATIAITIEPAGSWPAAPAGTQLAGTVFDFGPDGTTFLQPVTVTLPFDPSQFPPGAAVRLLHGTSAGVWEELPGLVVGATSVSAQTMNFSPFVVGVGNTPPFLVSQPADASVLEPATATFSIVVLGTPPITLQWQRSDDGGASYSDIAGAAAASYTTPATVAATDNGARFRVRATNLEGSTISNAATLTVTAVVVAPAITRQPQDLTVVAGNSAAFNVAATGTSLAYQWQRSNDGGATFANVGADAPSFSLTATVPGDDQARFRVVVSNSAGSVTSDQATLTVTAAPAAIVATSLAVRSVALAVLANGNVRSWGDGNWLGDPGASADRTTPGPVPGLAGVVSVAAGSLHSLALTAAGEVWGWGYNGFGALGDGLGGAGVTVSVPKKITTIANVVAIAAGNEHSVFLKSDGTVWTAGANGLGQLGDGTFTDRNLVTQVAISGVVAISTSADHTLALKSDGTVWGWGLNSDCQLGDAIGADPCVNQRVPKQVVGLSNAMRIAAGGRHSLALVRAHPGDAFGDLWGWGLNDRGQLGIDVANELVKNARLTWHTPASEISTGDRHSLLMHFDGTVFAFGDNTRRQLGDASYSGDYSDVPRWLSALPGSAKALCASTTNLILLQDGSVWAWGDNTNGQVGNGTQGSVPVAAPVRVTGLNLN